MTAMDWIELDDDGKPLSRPSSVSSFQSSHSRLSFLTTSSSLSSSSTFSDISINSLASVPSPPPTASKTHAFFSSPFPTRPPSPAPSIVSLSSQAQRHQQHQPSPPAPPALVISTQRSPDSALSCPKYKPNDFFAIPSIDISAPNAQQDEQTPRPPNLEPSLSQLWARQSNSLQPPSLHTTLTPSLSKSSPPSSPSHSPPTSPPSTLPPCDSPRPGYVISSNLPASPLTSATSLLSPDARNAMPSATPMDATNLRLVRLLGHGAFSSVWLADDLSSVPLVLRTRKSLRDLKRQASLGSENSVSSSSLVALLNPSASLDMTLSRSGSLKRLRERVGGTKPIGSLVDGSEERFFVGDESESPLPGSPSAASAALHRRHTTASSPSHRGAKVDDAVLVSQIGWRGGSLRLLEQDRRRLRRDRAIGLGINPDLDPHDAPDADYEMGDEYWRSVHAHLQRRKEEQRLVAVKMTVRSGATGWWGDSNTLTVREREEREKEKERTRVAFVREVEVLRHISHPNITPLLTHLSTPTHHVLVLPYLPGGDLLSLVNSDNAWSKLRESVLRRMWNEVCKAVGWMHSVGIVHRDLKLENILLTTCIFADLAAADARSTNAHPDNPSENATPTLDDPTLTAPTLHDFPPPPLPLIKLTDFGLSRFVDIRSDEERDRDRTRRREAKRAIMNGAAHNYARSDVGQYSDEGDNVDIEELEDEDEGPLLHTRCGSEAYAAPELVIAGGSSASSPVSQRKKSKPAGIYDGRETDSWACGVVLYALIARRLPFGEGVVAANESSGVGHVGHGGIGASGGRTQGGRLERRQWLMRIARGEYEWPEVGDGDDADGHEASAGKEELIGERLALSQGAKKVVERLLVRDPKKRARVADLLTDEWVCGWDGSIHSTPRSSNGAAGIEPSPSVVSSASSFSSFGSCLTIRDLGLDSAVEGYGLAGHQEQLVGDAPNGHGGMNDSGVGQDIGLDDVVDIVEDLGEGWLVDEHGIDKVARREVIA